MTIILWPSRMAFRSSEADMTYKRNLSKYSGCLSWVSLPESSLKNFDKLILEARAKRELMGTRTQRARGRKDQSPLKIRENAVVSVPKRDQLEQLRLPQPLSRSLSILNHAMDAPQGIHSKTTLFIFIFYPPREIIWFINNVLFLDSFGKSENWPWKQFSLGSILL